MTAEGTVTGTYLLFMGGDTKTEWLRPNGMRPNYVMVPEWDRITFWAKSEWDRIFLGPRNETESHFSINRNETESHLSINRKETESENHVFATIGTRPNILSYRNETESHFIINRNVTESHLSINQKETESENHVFATIGMRPNYFELPEWDRFFFSFRISFSSLPSNKNSAEYRAKRSKNPYLPIFNLKNNNFWKFVSAQSLGPSLLKYLRIIQYLIYF
jgi:hypothetical protein